MSGKLKNKNKTLFVKTSLNNKHFTLMANLNEYKYFFRYLYSSTDQIQLYLYIHIFHINILT